MKGHLPVHNSMDVLPAAAHFHTEVGEIIVLFDVSP
jgi:hypothetical protein